MSLGPKVYLDDYPDLDYYPGAVKEDLGWLVSPDTEALLPELPNDPDLFVGWLKGRRVRVAVERVRGTGRANLEAHLSRAILRLAALEDSARRYPEALVVLVVDTFSPRSEKALAEFVRTIVQPTRGGRVEWIATDGQRVLGPAVARAQRVAALPTTRKPRRRESGFSDAFLVLTKVLALAALESTWRPTGRKFPAAPLTVEQLAATAGLSIPQIYRFVATYERLGYVRKAGKQLELTRFIELAKEWALKIRPIWDTCVWADFEETDAGSWKKNVAKVLGQPLPEQPQGLLLGVHSAAAAWGLEAVIGAPTVVYSFEHLDKTLKSLRLRSVERSQARVWVLRPPLSKAVWFGGSLRSGFRVTDVVQSYLDALAHPVRGAEQAGAMQQALAPLLNEETRG